MHGARVVEDSGIACRASSAGAKRRWPNNSRFRRRTRSSRTALVGAVAEASSGVRNGTLGAYSARDGPRGSIRIGPMERPDPNPENSQCGGAGIVGVVLYVDGKL